MCTLTINLIFNHKTLDSTVVYLVEPKNSSNIRVILATIMASKTITAMTMDINVSSAASNTSSQRTSVVLMNAYW